MDFWIAMANITYMYIDRVAKSIECFKFAYKQSFVHGKFFKIWSVWFQNYLEADEKSMKAQKIIWE